MKVDPDVAMNRAINKFIDRFEYIEKYALSRSIDLDEMTLEKMESLWQEAKSTEI